MTNDTLRVDETAHCREPGIDPERFHPAKGSNGYTVDATKKLCTGSSFRPPCPFLDKCREYGITHSVHGIWGGLAEDGRKAARKARRIVPAPLPSLGAYPKRNVA